MNKISVHLVRFLTTPLGTNTISTRMSIGANGNVGIGTPNPDEKLEVAGDSAEAGIVVSTYGSGTTPFVKIRMARGTMAAPEAIKNGELIGAYDSEGYGATGWGDDSNSIAFWATEDWTDTAQGASTTLWTTANGTAIPTVAMKIDHNGDVTGTFGDYHVASDIRLKKDVVTIPNALEKVSKLRGVNFMWKDCSDNESLKMGMIAQEVEKVIPEVVHTADDVMKTKAVEYQYLVGLLVEGIKELNSKVENSESDNVALRAQNEQLKEKFLALGARFDTLETMFLTKSYTHPKEKLVKLDQLNVDEVQKAVQ